MQTHLIIDIAQINTSVGDFDGNITKITEAAKHAQKKEADLVVFPELTLTGYPPEDLVLRPSFQKQCLAALEQLAQLTKNTPALLIGTLWKDEEKLNNAAALLAGGKITHIIKKQRLPNYGVFDEYRIFTSAETSTPVIFNGVSLGVMICEDMWNPEIWKSLHSQGAEIFISLNASPFEMNKHESRMLLAKQAANHCSIPLVYVNQIGGQDELIFDGGSFVLANNGSTAHQCPYFEEHQQHITFTKDENNHFQPEQAADNIATIPDSAEAAYKAVSLGLKDYIHKNGFAGVVIGMSGGIDSALTAAIAVDALGKDKVRLVMMPSRYTSDESLEDAESCATRLGVEIETIAIEPVVDAFSGILSTTFSEKEPDTTEENIQSRIRGLILMAISNKFGHMVLTTGNKSEMAVGYATLYGDMCGGYNVLKDLYKTEVFALSRWRNTISKVIPERIITKPPSAELRPDQKDEDSLPPYEMLDDILYHLIEKRCSSEQIANEKNYELPLVQRISRLVTLAEYKRRQAPPGAKVGTLAFGRDRRYPITHQYRL